VLLAAALLLWPALWNGYPIVFADSGTYLSQAVHHYLGWDRPVFYSLAILPLHLTLSTWPVVVAQSLLAAWVLHLVCRVAGCPAWTVAALSLVLTVTAWLPWLVCEIMPDLFTPLLVLVLALLIAAPHRLARRERGVLVALATLMIAAQQSSLPLAAGLIAILLPLRRWLVPRRPGPAWLGVAPLVLALAALVSVNGFGLGRVSVSPYGNMFLLARVLYDGPGTDVLRRDCPAAGWRLCPFRNSLPPTSDDFLWLPDSPVVQAGGHKAVSADADAIIAAALRAEPWTEVLAMAANTATQLGRFASGDGLEPWTAQVSPRIDRDFPPAERRAYHAALQQSGTLAVPAWLGWLHAATALAGLAACLVQTPWAVRRHHPLGGLLVATLLAIPLNAAIAGALSGPHDRYQARIMWLPPALALVAAAGRRRGAA
jgi:hypothetical protein